MKRFFVIILVFFVATGCGSGNQSNEKIDFDNIKENKLTESITSDKKTNKKLTVYFLDISGSFNKIQENLSEVTETVNYFELACDEIIDHIENRMVIGKECIIIKKIQSNSFLDDAQFLKIDLSSDKYSFSEKKPEHDMKMKGYEKRRRIFNEKAFKEATVEKLETIKRIEAFKEHYKNNSSGETDIINALNSIKFDLSDVQYQRHDFYICIYSDFQETTKKDGLKNIEIDLGGINIVGRYVSKNNFTSLDEYKSNIEDWKNVLKCNSLEFLTPDQCIKY
ncbi:hypothetical protein Q4Q39_01065 [Flavivirga amylovorans]|uniref:Lipoprotein n=1 Tax=Flavivirga amylovorans TaxID=870486 RepID=A0ABT8WWB2_9FLAO|nr:hypothetical protein [Flavivirga amylovorans]MDO5985980.1 hypothetical protein [Flavivirga amylovorans]